MAQARKRNGAPSDEILSRNVRDVREHKSQLIDRCGVGEAENVAVILGVERSKGGRVGQGFRIPGDPFVGVDEVDNSSVREVLLPETPTMDRVGRVVGLAELVAKRELGDVQSATIEIVARMIKKAGAGTEHHSEGRCDKTDYSYARENGLELPGSAHRRQDAQG